MKAFSPEASKSSSSHAFFKIKLCQIILYNNSKNLNIEGGFFAVLLHCLLHDRLHCSLSRFSHDRETIYLQNTLSQKKKKSPLQPCFILKMLSKIYAKTLTKNLVLSNNTIKRFTLTLKSSQLLQNEIMPTMLLGIS